MKGLDPKVVRRSVIAGSWYPGSASALASTIDGFMAAVDEGPLEGELRGLISPHAGYSYSGGVAAYAYKQLEGKGYPTVVIVSPIHRHYGGRYLVTGNQYYETPFGMVKVDAQLVNKLDGEIELNFVDQDAEHSLEIQLPFLQHMLGEFTLLPVMMGDQGLGACRALSAALNKVLGEKEALLVASSDLAHLHDYEEVVAHDRFVQGFVNDFDPEGLASSLAKNEAQACGGGPIVTVMLTARELGADSARVLKYMNSGDVTGVRAPGQYTVGYLAGVVYKAA
ncbi:MAG: AmmeMemoRadiSam system protein B [Anaerolineae bacterium]|nr:AmmeMemoRadiSam system protein B [Anaerolineae bacterium]NIN99675.1 AmmeMemoRadiSam system protein B [Anaerolineae bacterium]NIQ82528.1 AmmeMemoRadiSam system protein B [Anaerolineae bacterium]